MYYGSTDQYDPTEHMMIPSNHWRLPETSNHSSHHRANRQTSSLRAKERVEQAETFHRSKQKGRHPNGETETGDGEGRKQDENCHLRRGRGCPWPPPPPGRRPPRLPSAGSTPRGRGGPARRRPSTRTGASRKASPSAAAPPRPGGQRLTGPSSRHGALLSSLQWPCCFPRPNRPQANKCDAGRECAAQKRKRQREVAVRESGKQARGRTGCQRHRIEALSSILQAVGPLLRSSRHVSLQKAHKILWQTIYQKLPQNSAEKKKGSTMLKGAKRWAT
jgi:hypothetical protein